MNKIKDNITAALNLKQTILHDELLLEQVNEAATIITQALLNGKRVLFCGNGGSAADAQHLAAELSGRFYLERKALNAEAININIPFLTAVSNDYDYSYSYARYLEGAANQGDVLVLLSTSGNSPNIVRAAETANTKGVITISLTGKTGGKLVPVSKLTLQIPSTDTPRIQEAHMLLGHCICELVESNIFGNQP